MQEFNFRQMLIESIETVQYITSTHQVILDEAVDVVYKGDRFRIEQVVNNFLANAIKYSPSGGKVIVKSYIQFSNLIVSVKDFGIGIDSGELTNLFERYYRIDNPAMHFEGLGLGLFISSEILKRHNGCFWIDSEAGNGSTFYFRLPLSAEHIDHDHIDQESFYKDDSINISYNHLKKRLDVDWTGFQSLASIKKGCIKILMMINRHQVRKVINDNSNVIGTWAEAAEWVGEEWMPMMKKAGIDYLAWIYSPGVFGKLSARKTIERSSGSVNTCFFAEWPEADLWLDQF